MKKILFGVVAATSLLVACDPVEEGGTFNTVTLSEQQVSDCVQFTVYKDEACTQPAGPGEGNWVKYITSPATSVSVYNFNADGTENLLAWGPTGVFKLSPKRGSANEQPLKVRFVDANNIATIADASVNVWVKSDLEPEMKLLLGEAGKKNWAFAADGNEYWGNAGNSGNGAGFTATAVDGKWWGVKTAEELAGQKDHAKGDETFGLLDAAEGSYMTLDEDNNIISYTADGKMIRKGSFQIKDFNPGRDGNWQIATLTTSAPVVLWPYSINENGKQVNEFDVMYLDGNHMTLVYTKGNGAGSWGEITYWRFVNVSPSADVLEGSTGKWGWATSDDVEIWGNAGNSGNGAGFTRYAVDGKWWGVKTGEELEGQNGHAGGVNNGDESSDSYMIFNDGKVITNTADNTLIRGGKYELDIYPDGRKDNWELGKLTTSEPALLFPWSINEAADGKGKGVTEFDVMYMDGGNMTLVYTKGNGSGSWGEITYWRFEAK